MKQAHKIIGWLSVGVLILGLAVCTFTDGDQPGAVRNLENIQWPTGSNN